MAGSLLTQCWAASRAPNRPLFDRRAVCPCEFNCSRRTTEWCGHPSGASWFSATPTHPQPSCSFRHRPPSPRRRPRPGRHGARDLWDLWALSHLGAINGDALDLYQRHGPTNRPPASWLFDAAPSDTEWQAQLAGQPRITVSARTALDTVRAAWHAAAKIPDDQHGSRNLGPINDE